jgi:hypothetical protein
MAESKVSIFISAVTRDLGSYRQIVRDELLTAGFFPVLQEHFRPDARSLIGFLERTVAECDVVVCLLGPSAGDGPAEISEAQRSFTQIEYDVARRFGKPIYAFIASTDCPLDNPVIGDAAALQMQQEHLQSVMNTVKCDFFVSPQSLREKILRLIPLLPRIARRVTPPEPYLYTGRKSHHFSRGGSLNYSS